MFSARGFQGQGHRYVFQPRTRSRPTQSWLFLSETDLFVSRLFGTSRGAARSLKRKLRAL